jgi:UDP-N-acetylmuramoyl-tripeptide--D-alanyl-D-alanine ligase
VTVMTAGEIARRAGGVVDGDANATVDAWGFDSRALAPGSCFVALKGGRDGHEFVAAAFDAGARVALIDRDPIPAIALGTGRALVRVPDALAGLQRVATSIRADRADLRVVAVTGSTGKTSTKDLLAAALAPLGTFANAESYNNEFGLPLTLCNTPHAAAVVVTEMGERFVGDLTELCAIAQPTVGVVTNVGLAHAEHLGGHAGTVEVLSEMLRSLPEAGVAVLNADDPFRSDLSAETKAHVLRAGFASDAEYRIEDVQLDAQLRPTFRVQGYEFSVPLRGEHHAQNAAQAIAVAHGAFGMAFDVIATELAGAAPARWRMEFLETDDDVIVLNDAYNANPTSMEAALVALGRLPAGAGARVAVLGDMRELGAHHDDAHRDVGARAAELGFDLVVGVGAGGALIAAAASENGVETIVAADAEAAVALLDERLRSGDAVLVKGSRALGLERIAHALVTRRQFHEPNREKGGAA